MANKPMQRTALRPATFIVGIVLSVFLAILIRISAGRSERIRELVALRTR